MSGSRVYVGGLRPDATERELEDEVSRCPDSSSSTEMMEAMKKLMEDSTQANPQLFLCCSLLAMGRSGAYGLPASPLALLLSSLRTPGTQRTP
jgi:hypothetical protein